MEDRYLIRKTVDFAARWGAALFTALAVIPLISVIAFVAIRGAPGLSASFFTQLPTPVGEPGGGMANAIVGTLTLVLIASIIGVPLGVMSGIYLSEAGPSRMAKAVRFSADVLSGVPSIAIGIFAYTLLVRPIGHFSAWAGGFALGVIMVPTVTRTTEELLKLVPSSLREAALALGIPRWRATLRVVLRTAAPGVATGVMLAVARIAGETAPLLFTAFNNRFWADGLGEPTASLPVQIYTYSVSPYDDWHQQAWAAAMVLVGVVLVLNVVSRLILRQRWEVR
jgi:phosphate transport system permease protein